MSRLGPSFMKIWTWGSSPQSGSWNAWTRIKNVNGASCLSNFWNFFSAIKMISCYNWWPWTKRGYITMTRRQSNNHWSGSIAAHPAPKNSKCKNSLEKFTPQFLGIKTASSSLIIFQKAKLSMRSITHLCRCNWSTFWKKNTVGRSQRCLVLARQCPGSPCTCNPEETALPGLPMSWSPTLFSRSGPVPWTEKTIKGHHFSSDAEVIAAAETWLARQHSEFFLSGLQKLEPQAKKCIELCVEYVKQIPSLVAVACFLLGWAKDLSACPRTLWIWLMHRRWNILKYYTCGCIPNKDYKIYVKLTNCEIPVHFPVFALYPSVMLMKASMKKALFRWYRAVHMRVHEELQDVFLFPHESVENTGCRGHVSTLRAASATFQTWQFCREAGILQVA